jgi:HlyD family secretion protein
MNTVLSSAMRYFAATKKYLFAHKVISAILIVVVLALGYWEYGNLTNTSGQTLYVLGTVQTGTVISIVSGSGQVSPSDQITINPKTSGTITKVYVTDGQNVSAGEAIASLDATDEYNAVQNAQASLQSAQIALQKLQEPADQLSLTQDQDAITKAQESETAAQTDLSKAYSDSYNDVVATFLDIPDIMTGLQDVDTGTEASKGVQWNIDYYKNATENWDNNALTYRDAAYNGYTTALTAYDAALPDYQATSQSSSTSTIESILAETYATAQSISTGLNSANSFLEFYESAMKSHGQNPSSTADTGLTNLNTYISKTSSHLSTLLADTNTIQSDEQQINDSQLTITEDQQSLQKLQTGADPLDVQSAQLNIQQQQNALTQAQEALDDYTITAPISGTIANLALNVGDTVSSGTSAATEITTQDIADLTLNEVDAAKVAAGQKATLTFDAIPDLSLTGSVADVSPLGTVSQGVVSYDVKISFDTQDPRVKAGMTVNADIETAVHQNVLIVPAGAIHTSGTASYVEAFNPALANTGGTSGVASSVAPQNIPVQIGISDDTNTEITSGLTAGEQIVVRTSSGGTAAKSTAAAATTRSGFGGGAGGAAGGIRL